jgi:predicted ATPase
MRLIDVLGLKNFRIFDDVEGFQEEMSSINILTGANNSGKSSIIKFLQLLRDSIKEGQSVFDLDLSLQEHLLGDFDNVLHNSKNNRMQISLFLHF